MAEVEWVGVKPCFYVPQDILGELGSLLEAEFDNWALGGREKRQREGMIGS